MIYKIKPKVYVTPPPPQLTFDLYEFINNVFPTIASMIDDEFILVSTTEDTMLELKQLLDTTESKKVTTDVVCFLDQNNQLYFMWVAGKENVIRNIIQTLITNNGKKVSQYFQGKSVISFFIGQIQKALEGKILVGHERLYQIVIEELDCCL